MDEDFAGEAVDEDPEAAEEPDEEPDDEPKSQVIWKTPTSRESKIWKRDGDISRQGIP